jgi:hypothetical protein
MFLSRLRHQAYALAHPRMDFLTVGPITIDQVRRTANSLRLSKTLNAFDLEYLHKVSAEDLELYRKSGRIRERKVTQGHRLCRDLF